ncbi:Glycosyl transferase group 1 family protein [Candidatus Propionivibrio aalborgensis]|uniref:Glycosyl transferase group 1 family protein n=1 Tax=Candidatus Propionivibrio aalborgensis TaxID=1860101 RepID=A0A1A8XZ55_9RHOO|nr:glycosyltransferase [Candidatus Propionivibrio aalborgensis]SBT09348.1 Glycosyl transferase group 1 family protein [Candidatus Propionivibrio aalborgensis]
MRPIPIVAVTRSFDCGGTEQHLLQTLPRLNREEFAVSVLALYPGGTLREAFSQSGLNVWPASESRLGALVGLATSLVGCRALIHCFLPEPYLLAAPVGLATGSLVLMSRRSRNGYQRQHPVAAWFERRLHSHMAALVGNSSPVVDDLLAEGAPPDRIRLIYNGVDADRFSSGYQRQVKRQEVRTRLGLSDDVVVLICVANLFRYKGHADLFEALAMLGPVFTESCVMLLAGRDAGELPSLRRQAVQLGISDKVQFLGERQDVQDLLAASDIGVLPSHEEGFSNAVLESMAAGLPMVVTDVGGNADAVTDGKCGYVVSASEPSRLAEVLAILILDAGSRSTMGDAARARVISSFSIASCVQAYEALYKEIWVRNGQA